MREGRQSADPWRGRAQLVGAILFAVLLPAVLRYGLIPDVELTGGMANAIIATALAVCVGHHFFRRIAHYPGSTAAAYIVPVFAGSYGVTLALLFLFLRLDFSSRLHLLLSFLGCILWYHLCQSVNYRARPRRYGVVPIGRVDALPALPEVMWTPLDLAGDARALDGIVVDFRAPIGERWERWLAERAIGGTPVYNVKQVEEAITGRVAMGHLSENNFGSLVPGFAYARIKTLGDLLLGFVAAALLAVPMVLIALAVRLDSKGPALFRQKRMGYRGRIITIYKFRSMVLGSDRIEAASIDHAITRDHDPRVTRIGRLLRRSRIDELPQIINILRGEMSWIGPRPEVVVLSRWYEEEIPFYRYRHIVRPGISGWAQVNQGHVADVGDVHGKLEYDFYYIKYFSATLDFLIMLKTMWTMLTGFGSR